VAGQGGSSQSPPPRPGRGVPRCLPQASWRRIASVPENRIVGLTAVLEGFMLVAFASASAILTAQRKFSMSEMRYGELVLPEVAAAIAVSLTGFGLARRYPTRFAYRLGVSLGLAATALLIVGVAAGKDGPVGFPLVMAGSAFLGAGFGVTVPVLMAYARFLNAGAEDRSLIALNTLLALGAIAAPGIAVLFTYVAPLWGLTVITGAALLVLLFRSARLPSHAGAPLAPPRHARSCAVRFLVYAVCAMFYAVCASIIVIWSQLMVAVPAGSATQLQLVAAVKLAQPGSGFHTSVALASCWGAALAAGRVMFAAVDRWRSARARAAGQLLPILVLAGLIAAGVLSRQLDLARSALFLLAGVGCSMLLPLHIGFSQKDVTAVSAALAGGIVAYQLAYDLVADGLRPSLTPGSAVLPIFAIAALIGLVMSALSFQVISFAPSLTDRAEAARANRRS
jgi:MFS family permease